MKAYYLQKRHLLSKATMEKRLIRVKAIQTWMRGRTDVSIIWTDEKIFTIESVHNHHNDRILARDINSIPVNQRTIFKWQKSASVMVWAGVRSCSKKMPLIFIPKGVKVNQVVYLNMLKDQVLPWINSEVWEHSYCFQQDGAPSRTAKTVQKWCKNHFQAFWPIRPPSSPDLNVMDFAI